MSEIIASITFYVIFSLFFIIGYFPLKYITKSLDIKISKTVIYLFSKPLGLILFAYPIWLLSSVKLLNYNPNYVLQFIFCVTILSLVSYYVYKNKLFNVKKIQNFAKDKRSDLLNIIKVEIISIVIYSFYLFIRSFNPNLNSTEKPMDILMLSSAGKADYFPFIDSWWHDKSVNYYYYGFYLLSIIIKISNIEYTLGYNLSLGLIFVLTFLLSASIVYTFTNNLISSITSGLLVLFAGNLHYFNCLVNNYNQNLYTQCFYPKATRILDPAYTINEITSYSFVLGDLHPHVISIIFFLLTLFLIIITYKKALGNLKIHLLLIITISSTALINFWDFITLGLIYGLLFLIEFIRYFKIKRFNIKILFNKEEIQNLTKILIYPILTAISPFFVFSPFFSHFSSPVEGIGFGPEFVQFMGSIGNKIEQYPSTLEFLFGIWGGFWIIIFISLLTFLLLKSKKDNFDINSIIVLFIVANFLIVFTELFYFKDMFHYINPNYFRSNTVFKLTYHSWIILCILSGLSIFLAYSKLNNLNNMKSSFFLVFNFSYYLLMTSILLMLFSYPFFAYSQGYQLSKIEDFIKKEKTLNGINFIKNINIGDYETINWLNKNQKTRVVILEAVGAPYTYYGRIAANTGMKNLTNWESHEWTWRFKYHDNMDKTNYRTFFKARYMNHISEQIKGLQNDLRTIYETSDFYLTQQLLVRYNVEYVYIGDLERSSYVINENKFNQFGKLVLNVNGSKLYKIDILKLI